MPRPSEILVPAGDGTSAPHNFNSFATISDLQSLVIVGANGAGKSRFGYAIEKANLDGVATGRYQVHRIAAQRALTVNDQLNPITLDNAEGLLYWGDAREGRQNPGSRDIRRWNQKPVTSLLNDFDALLQLVFAKTRERDYRASTAFRAGEQFDPDAGDYEAPADKVVQLWNRLLPRRRLQITESKILVSVVNSGTTTGTYPASEMSDGERVALYLMASAYVAPENSIIIIDEPEIHIHKSIRDSLFDALEEERSDCLFVYLTHDVDFAAARTEATKIWLKEFTGDGWYWEPVNDAEGVPPELVAELLGSRRPVLFVEGESDSLDTLIYTKVYPDRYVVPLGSCDRVIQFTKALRADEAEQLHLLDAVGIIDRDRRDSDEVIKRAEGNVHVLDVAEAENLLLLPGVVRLVASRLERDPDETLSLVIEKVIELIDGDLENQVAAHVHYRARRTLSEALGSPVAPVEALEDVVAGLDTTIDIREMWDAVESEFRAALDDENYEAILRLSNYKGLVPQVAPLLGLAKDPESKTNGLESFVRRAIQRGEADKLIEVFRETLPSISSEVIAADA